MKVVRNEQQLAIITDPDIRLLLQQRLQSLQAMPPSLPEDWGFFIVVESSDSIISIEKALGLNFISEDLWGNPRASPEYTPGCEWIDEHASCYELTFIFNDQARIVITPKQLDSHQDLIQLCIDFQ